MQISTALTLAFALSLQTSYAQLTGADRARALEILRKQLAEEQGVKTQPAPKPKPAADAPAKREQPKSAPPQRAKPAAIAPSTGFNQDRALEVLRRALAQEQGLPSPSVETPKSAKADEKATGAKKGQAKASAETVEASKTIEPAPVAPATAGPKSKGERLAELNALYFADKISPDEYHKRRAQIVSEP